MMQQMMNMQKNAHGGGKPGDKSMAMMSSMQQMMNMMNMCNQMMTAPGDAGGWDNQGQYPGTSGGGGRQQGYSSGGGGAKNSYDERFGGGYGASNYGYNGGAGNYSSLNTSYPPANSYGGGQSGGSSS